MKKFLLIFFIFFSCVFYDDLCLNWYKFHLNEKFDNIETIEMWIFNNINYTTKNGKIYQTAQETLDRQKGDCEDFAILFLAMTYKYLNKKGELIFYDSNRDGKNDHSVAKLNKKYYDTAYLLVYDEINKKGIEVIEFDEIYKTIFWNRNK